MAVKVLGNVAGLDFIWQLIPLEKPHILLILEDLRVKRMRVVVLRIRHVSVELII